MAIVQFPIGPNATPEQEQEAEMEQGEISHKVSYFYCSECCGSVFHLYDDGEIECANPRCGGIMSGIMVAEIGDDNA